MVVNDATRPTPSAEVLRVLQADLEVWLAAPGNRLAFVVATGTHRVALPAEIEHIFGSDLARAHSDRIFCHDAKDTDRLVHLGRTARGTEIWVNRLLAEARSVLLINSVEPHYFAGYTGGRKSLFPGLAGYETVWANHKLTMEAGSETLVLGGNPVHEDLEEATAVGICGQTGLLHPTGARQGAPRGLRRRRLSGRHLPPGCRGGRQAVRPRHRAALSRSW